MNVPRLRIFIDTRVYVAWNVFVTAYYKNIILGGINVEELTVEQIQMQKIEELKQQIATMVDPVKHAELTKQYETLLNEYVNKRQAPQQTIVTKNAKEIANEFLKNKKMTNREYVSKALEYREAVILETGKDPFMDKDADPLEVEKTVDTLKNVLDNTDSDVDFRILLNNVLVDDPQLVAKINRNRR